MVVSYSFHWEGSGLGESWWRVSGAGNIRRVSARYEASDYQREIATGYSDAEWQRDVVGAINLLVSESPHGEPVPQDLVDAFNQWRAAEYATHRAFIDANPQRYGVVDWENYPVFKRPPVVRGAHYLVRWNRPLDRDRWKYGCVGLGWQINGEVALAA